MEVKLKLDLKKVAERRNLRAALSKSNERAWDGGMKEIRNLDQDFAVSVAVTRRREES